MKLAAASTTAAGVAPVVVCAIVASATAVAPPMGSTGCTAHFELPGLVERAWKGSVTSACPGAKWNVPFRLKPLAVKLKLRGGPEWEYEPLKLRSPPALVSRS